MAIDSDASGRDMAEEWLPEMQRAVAVLKLATDPARRRAVNVVQPPFPDR
jgi:hypothetical protein